MDSQADETQSIIITTVRRSAYGEVVTHVQAQRRRQQQLDGKHTSLFINNECSVRVSVPVHRHDPKAHANNTTPKSFLR